MDNLQFTATIRREFDSVLQNPTPNGFQTLRQLIAKAGNTELQYFQNMFLSGIIFLLKNIEGTKRNDLRIEAIKSMTAFLKLTFINVQETYKTIVSKCLQQIFNFDEGQLLPDTPEELKLECISCIDIASKRMTSDAVEALFQSDCDGVIVMTQLCCVLIVDTEKYRQLRIIAINCVLSMLQIHDAAEFNDVTLRHDIANRTFKTLPRNVSTLTKIITGDPSQGTEIIAMAVKALGRLICLVMEDYEKEILELDQEIVKLFQNANISADSDHDADVLGLHIPRLQDRNARHKFYKELQFTPEWRRAATRRLVPLLESLSFLKGHESEKVRSELATMCIHLLEKCSVNLTPCLPQIVTFLIGLSVDESEKIVKKVKTSLKSNITPNIDPIFWDKMEEQFIRHLMKLPRIIYTENESTQLSSFLFIKGFINIVPENRLRIIFSNGENVNKFKMAFLAAAELDRNNDLLIDEFSIRNFDISSVEKQPWKQFRHLNSVKILRVLEYIFDFLGQSCVGPMLVNNFVDILNSNDSNCNEVIVLLILLTKSNPVSGKIVLNELVEEWHWNLATQPVLRREEERGNSEWFSDRTEGLYESACEFRYTDLTYNPDDMTQNVDAITINDAKQNVQHICLVLEAVGQISQTLGSQIEPYLFKLLHKLLEMAGSSNNVMHLAGVFAIHKIAAALKMTDPFELIDRNSDYIAFHVNKAIKRAESSSKALDILGTVLKFSSMDSILNLENIITTILEENSKHMQMKNTASFLRTFSTILIALKFWIEEKSTKIEQQIPTIENIEAEDDPYMKWIAMLESDVAIDDVESQSSETMSRNDGETTDNCVDNGPDDDEEEHSEMPKYIKITIDILNRSLNYLSSRDDGIKMIVLDTLESGVTIIKDYEDQLLPLTHAIWKPLCERFSDKNPIVLSKAYSLVVVLGNLTKDFIYQRITSDFLPKLFSFLQTSQKESLRKDSDVSYRCSQKFKFQKKILSTLGMLLFNVDVSPKVLDQAMESALGFLHKDQPCELKTAALQYFMELASLDPSAVFGKLNNRNHNEGFSDDIYKILDHIDKRRVACK